jgi:hypothetical protein
VAGAQVDEPTHAVDCGQVDERPRDLCLPQEHDPEGLSERREGLARRAIQRFVAGRLARDAEPDRAHGPFGLGDPRRRSGDAAILRGQRAADDADQYRRPGGDPERDEPGAPATVCEARARERERVGELAEGRHVTG